mmetsp:Transcript_113560/g.220158  ORF Transcript_113560/g.220158 Transcript_113560/m.220158 type:complete len:939 (+) Transcript_113560:87-2903(+)
MTQQTEASNCAAQEPEASDTKELENNSEIETAAGSADIATSAEAQKEKEGNTMYEFKDVVQEDERKPSLDDTISDPLSDAERDVLTKIRKEEAQIQALRNDIASLRARASRGAGSTSIAELRRIIGEANRLEMLFGCPRELLDRDLVAQEAEWPSAELALARKLLGHVDACEAATACARRQIEESDGNLAPDGICQALEDLVNSWRDLQAAEIEARKKEDTPAMQRVDLGVQGRATTVRLLCDALLDKAIELQEGALLKSNGDLDATIKITDAVAAIEASPLAARLRNFLQETQVQEALTALHVDIPKHSLFQVAKNAPPGGSTCVAMPPKDEAPGSTLAEPPGIQAAADCQEPPQAAPPSRPVPLDAEIVAGMMNPPDVPPKPSAFELESTAGQHRSSVHTDDADALIQTMASWAASQQQPIGSDLVSTTPLGPERSAVPEGSAALWHAVHVGDQTAVHELIGRGMCTAKMRDASGHSVLWHAVAFRHCGLVNLMLDVFAPGTLDGVELDEVHPRRGDTLLHLLCQQPSFGTQQAQLFKRISAAIPGPIFHHINRAGLTFLQIAASLQNFWVLTFVLRNFAMQAKALMCMADNAPLRALAEIIQPPAPHMFVKPEPLPNHFRAAAMLQQDESGAVPYADVAFDVGADENQVAAGRFLAHRIVVAAQSPALFEALEKLPLSDLPREKIRAAIFRVDPHISQEVWRTALQFMYTGIVSCSYTENVGKMIELLLACSLYKLPKPLLDFAQAGLYSLLPESPPRVVLKAFSICCAHPKSSNGTDTLDMTPTREASAYFLLQNAHRLVENAEPQEAVPFLEKILQAVEHSVFNPRNVPDGVAAANGLVSRAPKPHHLGRQQMQFGSGSSPAQQAHDALSETRPVPRLEHRNTIPMAVPQQVPHVGDPMLESLRDMPRDRLLLTANGSRDPPARGPQHAHRLQ